MERIIIIRSDGGVCSQINFWMVGEYFRNKGYKVKFDNDWFWMHGKDINGIFDRKFDLLKLFPQISYDIASPREIFYYRKCFRYINTDIRGRNEWKEKKPPVYLDGYYKIDSDTLKQNINSCFKIDYGVLDGRNQKVLNQIKKKNSVAIHVRRGDLAEFVSSYGDPLSSKYFLNAIQKLKQVKQKEEDRFSFYFFSDEPEWVREVLIPTLQEEINWDYVIVDINGSDKGYMDLLLMTACRFIITSKGSLGKYAALLAGKNIEGVILADSDEVERWKSILDSVMVVGEL